MKYFLRRQRIYRQRFCRQRSPGLQNLGALLATFLATFLTAAPATAQEDSSFQLDLAASIYWTSGDGLGEDLLGLRGAFHLSDRIWLEGRISYFDLGLDNDVWLTEVSLKYFWDQTGRAHWYVLGGPGTTFSKLDDVGDEGLFLHAGVGTQIGLTERTYFRLEFLATWNDVHYDDFGHDVMLGFGWRF